MAFPKSVKQLCTPAFIYFSLSMLSIVLSLFFNLGNTDRYNFGCFSCRVTSTALLYIVQIIYVLFWTYVLNLICKDGNSRLSWILILFPFIVFLLIILFFMIADI